MPESTERASPPVPPRLVISKPADEAANTVRQSALATRRQNVGAHLTYKEQGRTASEWIDIDDAPPRRRRTKRKSSRRHEQVRKPAATDDRIEPPRVESDFGRFFPKLSRILETSNESAGSSRLGPKGSDRTSTRKNRHRGVANVASVSRRSPRHRANGIQQRRPEGLLGINASLLSVLSGLTSTSDKSSGSNSTITQRSYNRRDSDSSRFPIGRHRRAASETASTVRRSARSRSPNVFDYMQASSVDDGHDGRSVISSSSSSHYQTSDAGSSQAPDTPSSRSTCPSLRTTRSTSVAELRRKYDPQYAGSSSASRSDSYSPDPSCRNLMKQPSVSDITEGDEDSVLEPVAPSEMNYDTRRRSSYGSQGPEARLEAQEEWMRQHMAYAHLPHGQHYVDPAYGQRRSSSMSSEQSTYAYHMAMQQYQYPSPPAGLVHPVQPQMNGQVMHGDRPPVPDAPDISLRTITGYEMLALELASTGSSVKPLYRKFEYLNHRILLHLQDELCELEEQLRTVDEIIAQMDRAAAEGQRTPASRRGEAYHGAEIHHRRTSVLGRIFVKTEQYNRAMSSYAATVKGGKPPDEGQIEAYQQWMSKHQPVHEFEARFLQHQRDLIVPSQNGVDTSSSSLHTALTYLPIPLMLPLLLFAIVPSVAGRLLATALIAIGAFIVTATTRIRQLMSSRDWAVCGAAYVLLMAAIAGCVPQHGG